jgi:hypothetical protein
LRTAIALETGSVVAHPAASKLAVAAEAWMNVRLVSLIRKSPLTAIRVVPHSIVQDDAASSARGFDAAQHARNRRRSELRRRREGDLESDRAVRRTWGTTVNGAARGTTAPV